MRYFSVTEWLKSCDTTDHDILRKIEVWVDILNPIRKGIGVPIVVTHGLRCGEGTSQHYFSGGGATDLRIALSVEDYDEAMHSLAIHLVSNPEIYRVCYYPPGLLFGNGGFHLDRKSPAKILYVSDPNKVDWKHVSESEFLRNVRNLKKR